MFGSKQNEINVGKAVMREDELEFTVEYKGENFILKYPSPYEKAIIEAEIARKLGGFSRDSFAAEHVALIESSAYANQLVIRDKSPSWFVSAWTCYDEECLHALFEGYLRFRGEFQKRIRTNGPEGGSKGGKP